MKNLGLYIHIPFCESKCYYCNFISFCSKESVKFDYVKSLINEIDLQKENYKNYVVDTIFIGGGTPSCLPSGEIFKILSKVKQCFNVDKNCEITVEANPNSITTNFANEISKAGVNRVSIGLQSANDVLLKEINRIHTKNDFLNALDIIKSANLKNINVDLLLGLPNQKLEDVKEALDLLIQNNINHISCYGLILEEGTKLYELVNKKLLMLPTEEQSNKMYQFVVDYLKKYGIFRYEVSNFAKPKFECKHNLKYWNRDEYLGLGLNSFSFVNGKRFNNESNLQEYINYYKTASTIKIENVEQVTTQDEIEETIMLSLRTEKGINLIDFKNKFNYDLTIKKSKEIANLIKLNLIKIEDNFLKCSKDGFYVLNQVILELI